MKIPREQVINRLREAGFGFNRKGKRDELWKRAGSTDFVTLSVNAGYPEPYVRSLLQNAGLTQPQIEQFLRDATSC